MRDRSVGFCSEGVGDYEGLENVGPNFGSFYSQTQGAGPTNIFFRRYGP